MVSIVKIDSLYKDMPEFGLKKGDSCYRLKGKGIYTKVEPTKKDVTMSPIMGKAMWIQEEFEFDEDNLKKSVKELLSMLKELLAEVNLSIEKTPPWILQKSPVGDKLLLKKESFEEWIEDLSEVDLRTGGDRDVKDIIKELKDCETIF
jgi:hypothetical protein